MKQILVIVSLLLVMFGLKSLGIEGVGGFDPVFLAALGLVILGSFSSAELVGAFNLPKVTGYILVGVLLGPQVSNILSNSVVNDTKIFTTLALGLIALSAGLELHLSSMKKVAKTLTYSLVLKLIAVFSIITFGLYFSFDYFEFFNPYSASEKMVLALIFAALSIGTSPAIVLAIINESKLKGRIVDITLGMAVLKDVVVVLALAICITVGKTMLGGDGGSFSPSVLIKLGKEIGLSIFVGAILGGLLILYIRYIKIEMLFFVIAVILAVAKLSAALHLELLLVFIVAGFIVSNFSEYEMDLLTPLEKVALPVFIIFFTNAGAALNLNAIGMILPIALILFVLRAVAFYLSGYAGAALAGENKKMASSLWLCYLPQAGVTLGLVGIASSQMTEYKDVIESVGMGMVGLNLLLGPVTLRWAFGRSAEVRDESTDEEKNDREEDKEVSYQKSQYKIDSDSFLKNTGLQEKDIYQLEDFVGKRVESSVQLIQSEVIEPSLKLISKFCTKDSSELKSNNIERFELVSSKIQEKVKAFSKLRRENHFALEKLPQQVQVHYQKEWLKTKSSDSIWIKLAKMRTRVALLFQSQPTRDVYIRAIFKKHLISYFFKLERSLFQSWMHAIFSLYRELSLHNSDEYENLEKQLQEKVSQFDQSASRLISFELQQELKKVISDIELSGTVYLPEAKLRLSHYENEFRENEQQIEEENSLWLDVFDAYKNYLKAQSALTLSKNIFLGTFEKKIFLPAKYVVERFEKETPVDVEQIERLEKNVKEGGSEEEKSELKQIVNQLRSKVESYKNQIDKSIDLNFEKNVFVLINNLGALEQTYKIVSTQSLNETSVKKFKFSYISLANSLILDIESKVVPELKTSLISFYQELLKEFEDLSVSVGKVSVLIEGWLLSDEEQRVSEKAFSESLTDMKSLYHSFVARMNQLQEDCENHVHEVLDKSLLNIESLENKGLYLTQTSSTLQRLKKGISSFFRFKYKVIKDSSLRLWGILTFSGIGFESSQELKALKSAIENESLDVHSIKKYIHSIYFSDNRENVPQSYLRLFDLEPSFDERMLIKSKSLHNFLETTQTSQKMLVVGDSGLGKSTLINIASTRAKGTIIELNKKYHHLKDVFRLLANELGVQPTIKEVLNKLNHGKYTIVVDDLNTWWLPSQIQSWDLILEVIQKSPQSVTWICSMSRLGYFRLEKTFDFSSVFSSIEFLERMQRSEVKDFIKARHRYSSKSILYPSLLSGKKVENYFNVGSEKLFHQLLYEGAIGNFRLMSLLWCKSISDFDAEDITMSFAKCELGNFNFVKSLSLSKKIILKELLSYKMRTAHEISEGVGYDYDIVQNEIRFLEKTELIEKDGFGYYLIPIEIAPSLSKVLS